MVMQHHMVKKENGMPPGKLNPDFVRRVKEVLKSTPYFELLSMEMEDLHPGRAVFRIPAQKKHTNPFDNVHGGVFASIIDAATFWAIYSLVPQEYLLTTVELKINYLAPVKAEQNLLAIGEIIKLGRSLGVAEAKLTEEETGRLVGFGTATCMVLPPPLPKALAEMPIKFL